MKLYLSGRIIEKLDSRPGLEEFVALAAETGYDGVGLRAWQMPQPGEPGQIDRMKRLFDEAGLGVCSITTNLSGLAGALPAARALGTGVVQMWGDLAEAAALLDADMRVGPQMHTGGEFETVASAARALEKLDSPRVGVIVEPANLMLTGQAWSDELFVPLAGRIIGCNIQSIAVGQGSGTLNLRDGATVRFERLRYADNDQADFAGYFAALRAVGYDGYVDVIEVLPEETALKQYVADCAEFLRPLVS